MLPLEERKGHDQYYYHADEYNQNLPGPGIIIKNRPPETILTDLERYEAEDHISCCLELIVSS